MSQTTAELPDLATGRQVSEYLQIPESTLNRWRVEKNGPKFVKLGAAVRYRREDVLAWISAS